MVTGDILGYPAKLVRSTLNLIDEFDLDKHAASIAIMYGTMTIIQWAMAFASSHSDKSGIEIAAIIAAVSTPYMGLQTAALSFYFRARTSGPGQALPGPNQ